jgi:hypothetical protein
LCGLPALTPFHTIILASSTKVTLILNLVFTNSLLFVLDIYLSASVSTLYKYVLTYFKLENSIIPICMYSLRICMLADMFRVRINSRNLPHLRIHKHSTLRVSLNFFSP